MFMLEMVFVLKHHHGNKLAVFSGCSLIKDFELFNLTLPTSWWSAASLWPATPSLLFTVGNFYFYQRKTNKNLISFSLPEPITWEINRWQSCGAKIFKKRRKTEVTKRNIFIKTSQNVKASKVVFQKNLVV